MPHVKLSNIAQFDIKRLHAFLDKFDTTAADNAIAEIFIELEKLETDPFAGNPIPERPHVRKLVVNFGAKGYLIFHRYYEDTDVTLVSTILHQNELYNVENIGIISEIIEKNK